MKQRGGGQRSGLAADRIALYMVGTVPNRDTGSCLDPGLPKTRLQRRMGKGEGEAESWPGLPTREGENQSKSGRDGGNIMKAKEEEPIRGMMQEDQWPIE